MSTNDKWRTIVSDMPHDLRQVFFGSRATLEGDGLTIALSHKLTNAGQIKAILEEDRLSRLQIKEAFGDVEILLQPPLFPLPLFTVLVKHLGSGYPSWDFGFRVDGEWHTFNNGLVTGVSMKIVWASELPGVEDIL